MPIFADQNGVFMILQFVLVTCQITRWQPFQKSWLLKLTKSGSQPLDVSLRCVLACGQKVRDVFDFIVEQSLGAPSANGLRHVTTTNVKMGRWILHIVFVDVRDIKTESR